MLWKEGNRVLLKRSSGAWSEGVIVPGREGHIGVRCIDNGIAREKHIPIDRMRQFVRDVFTQSDSKRRKRYPKMKRRFSCVAATMDKMIEYNQLTYDDEIQYGELTPNKTCRVVKHNKRGYTQHIVVDSSSGQKYETINMWAVKEHKDKSKKAIHQCYRKRCGSLVPVLQLRKELEGILREKDQYHSDESASDTDSPLIDACKSGNIDLLKFLLTMRSTGCNPHTITSTGHTPLGIAAVTGQRSVVQYLLRYKQVDANVSSKNGCTPLYLACSKGQYDIAEMLLSQSDVNKKDYLGKTPFYAACENGHSEIVELLLSCEEVARHVIASDGKTPFYAAVEKGHLGVISLLCRTDDVDKSGCGPRGQTAIYRASKKGYLDIVRQLLMLRETNVNIGDSDGKTPLFVACEQGHSEIAEILTHHISTNVNVVNDRGESAIFIASQKGHRGIVELLLDWNTIKFNERASCRLVEVP